jgi:hypothetical protein
MTDVPLDRLFAAIPPTAAADLGHPLYAVVPVPGQQSYFIGRDEAGRACLLIRSDDNPAEFHPPIRLKNFDAQFALRCRLRRGSQLEYDGIFNVICCRSPDPDIIKYFFSVCGLILQLAGPEPRASDIAQAVTRLAAIFQRMQSPPSRPVNGLFGELYFLWRSANLARAVIAWREDDAARFDFSDGDIRLDIKVTTGRSRVHSFSYEQCNPPPATIAVVASLFVERASGGTSLKAIFDDISARIAKKPDLVLKLHEVVVETLGETISEALSVRFDIGLTGSSIRYFKLNDIPAIRGKLPPGVSDIHFRSDLSFASAISPQRLIDMDPKFWDLLPRSARS